MTVHRRNIFVYTNKFDIQISLNYKDVIKMKKEVQMTKTELYITPEHLDSFQEQARKPTLQQMHPEQMKPDHQGPGTSNSTKNKTKINININNQ